MKQFALWFAACFSVATAGAQELKSADLGEFKLESGAVIRGCRIGYRTFGKLNAEKSNAVLFPTIVAMAAWGRLLPLGCEELPLGSA